MSNEAMRPDIQAALDAMSSKFGTKGTAKQLPKYIQPDETVLTITNGGYGDSTGLLVITDKQALFLSRWAFKTKVDTFPRANISNVQVNDGLMLATITISSAGGLSATIKNVDKKEARQVQAALQS